MTTTTGVARADGSPCTATPAGGDVAVRDAAGSPSADVLRTSTTGT